MVPVGSSLTEKENILGVGFYIIAEYAGIAAMTRLYLLQFLSNYYDGIFKSNTNYSSVLKWWHYGYQQQSSPLAPV